MDTMSRKKTREAVESLTSAKENGRENHVADDFRPKVRPRETHPDSVNAKKRISGNLHKLNRSLVEHPKEEKGEIVRKEDNGARVETRAAAVSAPIPLAFIFSLFILVAVFMYMVSLNVQVEEYSHSIDVMESRIAELKEETTQLEVQLESKYDLDEVERIATQEYGMVLGSTLSKKYISVSSEEDVWQETEKVEEKENFFSQIVGGIKTFLGKNEK